MPSRFHFQGPNRSVGSELHATTGQGTIQQAKLRLFVRIFWPVVYALILILLLLMTLVQAGHAGGPRYVAGSSYFDPSTKGMPLTWAQGAVSYYTDPGDLSTLLPQASADAFVADAFSRWTLIPTAAVSATRAGQLAEEVNGSNVYVNSDGTIAMPADILPGAIDKPLGIVYDADGKVTDALLGLGAGGSGYCFSNAVFGGLDNLASTANFAHALVIMNGNCAQTAGQLGDLKYNLVRALGRVLGLDWSQLNLNVITRSPVPKPEDYAGFTIMHALDPISCVPISACYTTADQPKMDDRAALSRLYPVTTQNQPNFPGKQLFYENTIRIHGSVHFVDASGQPAQPMQGANVVARWIDPATGKPSGTFAAASVSGFLFRGNAGNPVNGLDDPAGQPFDQFGSDDPGVEGWFDLAGLEIPNGGTSAQYQLSTESLDPLWSQSVGPYGPWQVQLSGAAQPIIVTVSQGGNLQQDILMLGSAIQPQDSFEPEDYDVPAPVLSAGDWMGSLGGYGDSDYFWFSGQANRTMSVEVTALDETGSASESKALPVVGMWALSDPPGNPAAASTPLAFNSSTFGMSRLDAMLLTTTDFRIAISDYRGDGRPDYRYHARVLYGDRVIPARASVQGGTALAVQGIGFRLGNTVNIATSNTPVLALSSTQLLVAAPAHADGLLSITLSDPVTGSASDMTDVLTYGAAPNDTIRLIAGSNPATPVGEEAANPIRIGVFTADGVTPVAGASVVLSAVPAVSFAACGGAATCTLISDDSGQISTRVTVLTTGSMTITAALAPASYNPAKTVQATLQATSSALDLAILSPYQFIVQGATLNVPLSARLMSNGLPLKGRTINYQVMKGSGTLTLSNVITDASGYANTTLQLSGLAGDVQVSACVQPGSNPCQTYYATAVPVSQLKLEPVAGSVQAVTVGQNFQPVTVRVTDSATPPNPVQGVSVVFQSIISRPDKDAPVEGTGDGLITQPCMPVILGSSQTSAVSDVKGLSSLQPSSGGIAGPIEIEGVATVQASSLRFELELLSPISNQGYSSREVIDSDRGRGRQETLPGSLASRVPPPGVRNSPDPPNHRPETAE